MNTNPYVVLGRCAGWIMLATVLASCAPRSGPGEQVGARGIACGQLRCEYQVDPLGVDDPQPRLSWMLVSNERAQRQSAYRIQVASDLKNLSKGKADLWDTGRIGSDRSIQVAYDGQPLEPRRRCYWRVKVWDRRGKASAWSEPATWEMGLMAEQQWTAKWIDDGKPLPQDPAEFYKDDPAPHFRKPFNIVSPIRHARLYITGLGYYRASINGQTVGDRWLTPLWTDYRDRLFYDVYDVSELVHGGDNALGVTLGNGWYNPLPMRMWGRINLREFLPVGKPRFIAQLEITYTDGKRTVINSDSTWRTAPGPLIRNSIYLGEVYDARLELLNWDLPRFDDSAWAAASQSESPGGQLIANHAPPIRQSTPIQPVAITQPKPGVYVVDMGQNFTGSIRMRVSGQAGQTVKLRYGELLNEDGTVNVMTGVCGQIKRAGVGGPGAPDIAEQSDTYILRGGGQETFTPRFTFHGYRYVEVHGYPSQPQTWDFYGLPLHCDVPLRGMFTCSNPLYNDIEKMTQWTFLSNIMGVQSDCPHRERFGYGGDIVVSAEAYMLHYDMAGFYIKTVRDFADAVRDNGGLTETAPHTGPSAGGFGERSGPIGWGLAHPLLLHELHRYYGEKRLIEEQYAVLQKWIKLLQASAPDHILARGIGDHESLVRTPNDITGTAFYFHTVKLAQSLANTLNQPEQATAYGELAQAIRQRFIENFIEAQTGRVKANTQTAYALALHYGLLPAELRSKTVEQLAKKLQADDTLLTTGIFGTKHLLDVLSLNEQPELAHKLVDHRRWPGWGYMLDHGATTLWEHWKYSDNTFSHNHPMFGSVSEWLMQHVAGVSVDEQAVGCDKFVFAPKMSSHVDWAEGRYESIRGVASCKWRLADGMVTMDVQVPVGCTATVYIPTTDYEAVMESGKPVDDSPGCRVTHGAGDGQYYEIGSGRYQFTAPYQP